jgi:hypothetical protein
MPSTKQRAVKLESLPEGLQFPPKLQERIRYDYVAKELRFDGFMSKTDFDKLVGLHNDIAYQRALERLFQIATFDTPTEASPSRRPAWIVGLSVSVICLVLATAAWMLLH